MKHKYLKKLCAFAFILVLPAEALLYAQQQTVARQWNKAMLFSIERDFARPTIHSRNIFHTCIAMYDAWAVYDDTSDTYLLGKTVGDFNCEFNGIIIPADEAELKASRHKAISYACYRLLKQRFQFSPGASQSLPYYDSLMNQFGYPTNFFSQNYANGDPAALGNYLAAKIIEMGFQDGSNQQGNYTNLFYEESNPQIVVNQPGNPTLMDPNRWQAIFLDGFVDQSGNLISLTPPFLSPEWGELVPFAMREEHKTIQERDGHQWQVYMDPGPPPYIDTTVATGLEDMYKYGFMMVNAWQAHHDPNDGVMVDASPASIGNVEQYPETFEDMAWFYDFEQGFDQGSGHALNPKTGLPYTPQMVPRGDYARVLAEFWADGPNSETPPGHWFSILNYVNDHPAFEPRWNGQGPVLDSLEWNVKSYFTLGGAMYDAAIAAWSAKGYYDYPRPVSIIRWMADKGQSSDPNLPHFHPAGMPLIPGKVELVMPGDELAGDNDEHLYKIKLNTWRGHYYIPDPLVDYAGVGWILAENWWPYQRPNFVTPPFSGYVSGHSTFSRTAAEIMEYITGDEYFPGGMGEFHAEMNEFLKFEEGPSVDVTLQWATYQDASDQCSLSRIWGGIHPPQDDFPGRTIGSQLAPIVYELAEEIIHAGVPIVSSVSVNYEIVTNQLPQDFVITVSYNDQMNQNINPQISFSNGLPTGLISLDFFVWTSSQSGEFHFSVGNDPYELSGIGCTILGAQDIDGHDQRIFITNNLFDVDTDVPQLVFGSVSTEVVNIDLIGNATIEVDVQYDQAMDMNSVPLVSFESPIPVMALSNDITLGSWINSTSYKFFLNVADLEEECPDVVFQVTGARDLSGNVQVSASLDNVVDIDTKKPQTTLVTANTYVINEEFLETESQFQIVCMFNEAMNTDVLPEVVLISDDQLENILALNASESEWLNPFSYKIVYDVSPVAVNIENIGITLSSARDLAGNEMLELSEQTFFSINLNPAFAGNVSSSGGFFNAFPNPLRAGNNLNIYLPAKSKKNLIEVFDASGKSLILNNLSEGKLTDGKFVISTSGLASGIYTMRIVSDERSEVVRLVVVQ